MIKEIKKGLLETEQRYMDDCDEQLIHALAQRFCSCQMVCKYNDGPGVDTPKYWKETKKKLKNFARKYNIPYEMVEKVYGPIIEISKQLLNQK